MEKFRLISMTDFVLHESFGVGNEIINKEVFYNKCSNYANFLKQPLKLEMFLPCDYEGNILENPICQVELEQYRKAKEKVLFEGWEKRIKDCKLFKEHLDSFNSLEDVIGWDLTLTTNATKQIGL